MHYILLLVIFLDTDNDQRYDKYFNRYDSSYESYQECLDARQDVVDKKLVDIKNEFGYYLKALKSECVEQTK